MKPRSTVPFFLLTFAITWGSQLPAALATVGWIGGPTERYQVLIGLGLFGPLLAAVVVSLRGNGGDGMKALFAQLVPRSANAPWYLAALLMSPIVLALALLIVRARGAAGPYAYFPNAPPQIVALLLVPVVEEIGWRGFAFPQLQLRFGPRLASLLFGVIWALWHIPMFMIVALTPSAYLAMMPFFCAGALIITWLMRRSGGGLPIAILFHAGVHLSNSHQPLPADTTPLWAHTAGFCALAALLWFGDRGAWQTAIYSRHDFAPQQPSGIAPPQPLLTNLSTSK